MRGLWSAGSLLAHGSGKRPRPDAPPRPTSEDTALHWHCGPLSAAAAPRPWWRLPCPTPWFRGPGIPTIAPSGLRLLAGQTSPAGPKRGLDGAHAAAVGITRRHHAQQHREPPTRPPHHGQTTGDTPLRIRSSATAARRTARASSSGAVRGWTYAPDSIVAEFIGEVCHRHHFPALRPSTNPHRSTPFPAENGRVGCKLCHRQRSANQHRPDIS